MSVYSRGWNEFGRSESPDTKYGKDMLVKNLFCFCWASVSLSLVLPHTPYVLMQDMQVSREDVSMESRSISVPTLKAQPGNSELCSWFDPENASIANLAKL